MSAYPVVVSGVTPEMNDPRSPSAAPSWTTGLVKPGPVIGAGAAEFGYVVDAEPEPVVQAPVALVWSGAANSRFALVAPVEPAALTARKSARWLRLEPPVRTF